MSQDTIKIDHVSKLFRKQKQKTFKEFLPALFGGKSTSETFWALKDINLEVKKGDTIGIIGPNGSGKSTLLKLIAGVSKPTKGSITVNGRIAPLIELGAGFHPELSGRENVFLNGVILGMKRVEVEKKFKEIVDFAELWEFIDQPVKHYSSGMYLRLAFAVAVHTDPEILLVDEILAVGDTSFQAKCIGVIEKLIHNKSTTLVLVSHNPGTVIQICKKVIWLDKGVIIRQGNPFDVINEYSKQDNFSKISGKKTNSTIEENKILHKVNGQEEWGDRIASITNFIINDELVQTSINSGSSLSIVIQISNPTNIKELQCSVGIYQENDNLYISGMNTMFDRVILKDNSTQVKLNIKSLELNRGEYYFNVCLYSVNEHKPHHFIHKVFKLNIKASLLNRGIITPEHSWV